MEESFQFSVVRFQLKRFLIAGLASSNLSTLIATR
jgi:hypothetical protein